MKGRLKRMEVPSYITFALQFKDTFLGHNWDYVKTKIFDPADHPNVQFVQQDGWWLDRKANFSWVYYQGTHYIERAEQFRYELVHEHPRVFSFNEASAIKAMLKANLPLEPLLKKEWDIYCEWLDAQKNLRPVRIHGLQAKKRMAAFKASRAVKTDTSPEPQNNAPNSN